MSQWYQLTWPPHSPGDVVRVAMVLVVQGRIACVSPSFGFFTPDIGERWKDWRSEALQRGVQIECVEPLS